MFIIYCYSTKFYCNYANLNVELWRFETIAIVSNTYMFSPKAWLQKKKLLITIFNIIRKGLNAKIGTKMFTKS